MVPLQMVLSEVVQNSSNSDANSTSHNTPWYITAKCAYQDHNSEYIARNLSRAKIGKAGRSRFIRKAMPGPAQTVDTISYLCFCTYTVHEICFACICPYIDSRGLAPFFPPSSPWLSDSPCPKFVHQDPPMEFSVQQSTL